ncbi:MAG: hypothetical protein ACREKM_02245, partial [Longimicrobiales bacterium]
MRSARRTLPVRDAATPELQLLLSCARRQLTTADAARLRAVAATALDWQRVLTLARAHRLRPLLYW